MTKSLNLADMERNKFYTGAKHSPAFCLDHNIPIASGTDPDWKFVNKFGAIIGATTTIVDVNLEASNRVYPWSTTAAKLEAISSNANDTAAGSGARTVVVQGLDANFNEVTETLTMAGTDASAPTATAFIRIHRAYVATCGTFNDTDTGPHTGNITIRDESAGTSRIYLGTSPVAIGQSLAARFTVPAGYTGYLCKAIFSVDSTKPASFFLFRRENGDAVAAPFGTKRTIDKFDGIIAPFERSWHIPVKLPAKTDIWASILASGVGTDACVSFDIILVAD